MSPIQRQILQQEDKYSQRRLMMAEDADARTSALKKAKEVVLAKLSQEFQRRMGRERAKASAAASAATVAAAAASVSMGMPASSAYSSRHEGWTYGAGVGTASATTLTMAAGRRLRERLFGDPFVASTASSMAAPSLLLESFTHRSIESNSAMVPLIFSHA